MDNKKDLDVQGHRGCRGLMPENTIPAMIRALELGVTTLEMDVVVSKDKQVVLSHEPWFSQEITTKPDGTVMGEREERKFNIYWMTYEQVKTFDVGMKPHPRFPDQQKMPAIKPRLIDLIDSVENYLAEKNLPPVYYNIETKCLPIGDKVFHPEPAEFVDLLMAVIRNRNLQSRVIIQSFDFRTLQYLHQHYPEVKTAMLIEDSEVHDLEGQLAALGFVPTIYSPNYRLLDKKLIRQVKEKGMKLIPWTVNDKKVIRKLIKLGVDGIITDYPNLFK